MIATEVASPFLTPFKLSLVSAIFIAMPYILHQIWAFIAPASTPTRSASPSFADFKHPFVLCRYRVRLLRGLSIGVCLFTGVAPEGVTIMTDINRYLDFVLKLFFAFGLAFEIPIATMLLVWTGATTPQSLRQKRPFVILGCFIVGMLLTPPDVVSQILLAVPMWLLFEAGIIFSIVLTGKDENAEASPD